MDKTIRVVEVNTPYQIVLNIGKEDGVSINDKFLIFGLGKMISDPETGNDLEKLEIPRGEGKVIHVQNKICTVESTGISDTPKTITRINKIPLSFSLFSTSTEERETKIEKMPFDKVQIGDLARKVDL